MADGGLVLRAYGRSVGLAVPPELQQQVLSRLPPTYRRATAVPERSWAVGPHPAGWGASVEGDLLAVATDGLTAAELLMSDLELWVAEHARRHVFVHAGCAVWQGRAVVLPGRTMSGKSSLTAALVRAGATYWSDEYAVLDADGRVRPYARPLSIRPYDGSAPRRVPVEEYGGRAGRGAVPVGLVAHLRYTGEDRRETVSRGRSVLHLVDNAVPARRRPRAVLTALTAAVAGATCLDGTRGDADEAAAELLSLL